MKTDLVIFVLLFILTNNISLSLNLFSLYFLTKTFWKLINFDQWDHITYSNIGSNQDKRLEQCPPLFPNGWIPIFESNELDHGQIQSIFGFGYELVIYRGFSGKVYVIDRYSSQLDLSDGGTVVGENLELFKHNISIDNQGQITQLFGKQCEIGGPTMVKTWKSTEVNGYITVWHHSGKEEPWWHHQTFHDIADGCVYRGKVELNVNCHVQEIPENVSDALHFLEVHRPAENSGTVMEQNILYQKLKNLLKYKWVTKWGPLPEPKNFMSELRVKPSLHFGNQLLFDINLIVNQWGPVFTRISSVIDLFGGIPGHVLQSVISTDSFQHRVCFHVYTKPGIFNFFVGKFLMYGTVRQVERDSLIWNNKKYLKNPYLAQNETQLKTFRRWYKQFYSGERTCA